MLQGLASSVFQPGVALTPGGKVPGLLSYRTQATWNIDPVAGNDTLDGLTAATALKTVAELSARWGPFGYLPQSVNVFVLNDLPSTDPIQFQVISATGGVNVYGGPTTTMGSGATTVQSGTLATVTAPVRTLPTPECWTGIDTAIANWTAALGLRLRRTNGTQAICWVKKDQGGGMGAAKARFSGVTTTNGLASATLANGDTYVVETLRKATLGVCIVAQGAAGANGGPFFQDFAFQLSFSRFDPITTSYIFLGCSFAAGVTNFGTVSARNCSFTTIGNWRQLSLSAGASTGLNAFAGEIFPSGDHLVQSPANPGIFTQGGTVQITGNVAIFDGSSAGLAVGSTNAPASPFFASAGSVLYGAGNAQFGVNVSAGGQAQFPVASPPQITGTSGDFELAGDATNSRAFNDATGVYTATIASTWANFTTTVAGGGFGNNAHNVQHNAHIVSI